LLRYTSGMSRKRIGIFGGTFDPPHLGHLILSSEACYQLDLSLLLWVLTPTPPHKLDRKITSLEHRISMVKLAIKDNQNFELSTVEIDRPGPHYTLDTLRILSGLHPQADLILLIGGDSLHDLPTWHRPLDLVTACHQIGVMRRPGDSIDLSALEREIPGLTDRVRFVDAPLLEIASNQIRKRISEGRPFQYYLPDSVYIYIQEHKLYL
jgi:nicotinate-nucleotide adenylyltransferase